jgi:hypothetical protein
MARDRKQSPRQVPRFDGEWKKATQVREARLENANPSQSHVFWKLSVEFAHRGSS